MKNNSVRSTRHSLLSANTFVAALLCVFFLSGCDYLGNIDDFGKNKDNDNTKMFVANLKPLNNSGVTGTAMIKYKEDGKFQVIVEAKNLVPNMVHPQHIHGFDMDNKDATCPPESAAGDDGLLTLADGLPYYGPVLLPLDDKLVPLDADNFPTANAGGNLNYVGMVDTNSLVAAIDAKYEEKQTMADFKAEERVVVLHGAYVKDNKIVPAGTEGATYNATLPVACAEVVKK
ncbi:hypothetical protein [Pontibacter chitinilyticus]|uniref:hypothetical protein n=1 Tax=Pontibacter chitinilyticus TaxID=2674989 RepID=UPI0032199B8C